MNQCAVTVAAEARNSPRSRENEIDCAVAYSAPRRSFPPQARETIAVVPTPTDITKTLNMNRTCSASPTAACAEELISPATCTSTMPIMELLKVAISKGHDMLQIDAHKPPWTS